MISNKNIRTEEKEELKQKVPEKVLEESIAQPKEKHIQEIKKSKVSENFGEPIYVSSKNVMVLSK